MNLFLSRPIFSHQFVNIFSNDIRSLDHRMEHKPNIVSIRVVFKHMDAGLHSPLERRDEDHLKVNLIGNIRIVLRLFDSLLMKTQVNYVWVSLDLQHLGRVEAVEGLHLTI